MDDRLALGDLATFSVDRWRHRLVEGRDQQRRQVFRTRCTRLAAADRVIALVLGAWDSHIPAL
jgi:hypothetical protein